MFFSPIVGGDPNCINFPHLEAVLAGLSDERRRDGWVTPQGIDAAPQGQLKSAPCHSFPGRGSVRRTRSGRRAPRPTGYRNHPNGWWHAVVPGVIVCTCPTLTEAPTSSDAAYVALLVPARPCRADGERITAKTWSALAR